MHNFTGEDLVIQEDAINENRDYMTSESFVSSASSFSGDDDDKQKDQTLSGGADLNKKALK